MSEKSLRVYQLPKAAAILQSHLSHFQKLLHKEVFRFKPNHDPFPEDEYFYSNVALAGFINCSERTAQRLRKQGKIPTIKHGNQVCFHIPAVMEAIAKDERIASLFTRKSLWHRPKQDPKAYYSCFLKPGVYMMIDVSYQKWHTTIICSHSIWNDDELIKNLIVEVLKMRHDYKPFKISPYASK